MNHLSVNQSKEVEMDCEAERVENEKIHVGEMHEDSTLHARMQLRQLWQCGNKPARTESARS